MQPQENNLPARRRSSGFTLPSLCALFFLSFVLRNEYKVKLTFRDNDSHAIENGDQITVSWPESSAAAYFEGYNKTIPLKAKTNSGEIAVGFTGYGRYDRYGPMDFRPFTECLGSVLCLVSAKKEQLINACSGSVQTMFIRR